MTPQQMKELYPIPGLFKPIRQCQHDRLARQPAAPLHIGDMGLGHANSIGYFGLPQAPIGSQFFKVVLELFVIHIFYSLFC